MSYTREQAIRSYLAALGNLFPDQFTVWWFCGWSGIEIAATQYAPSYNVIGCGFKVPGSTDWNEIGHVQNYPSLQAASLAVSLNLAAPPYFALRKALAGNFVQDLINNQDVKSGLEAWKGTPGGYANDTAQFIADGQASASDVFQDTPSGQCIYDCFINSTSESSFTNCINNCPMSVTLSGGPPSSCVNTTHFLPDWLVCPDWTRIIKFVVGILLVAFGGLLIVLILSDKIASTQTFQTLKSAATKATKAASKAATVAAA